MAATSISTAAQTTTATKPIVPAIDDPEIIYPAKIYSNDPLYRLLKNHGSGINDYVIIAIVGVLTAVVFFGLGALLHTQYYGQWRMRSTTPSSSIVQPSRFRGLLPSYSFQINSSNVSTST